MAQGPGQAASDPGDSPAPLTLKAGVCRLAGDWSVQTLAARGEIRARRRALDAAQANAGLRWDLTGVRRLDAVGAHLLWRAWGARLPERVRLHAAQRDIFASLARMSIEPPRPAPRDPLAWLAKLGAGVLDGAQHGRALLLLLGQLVLDAATVLARPRLAPWREISAQVYHTGAQALGITALVGFLIGIVLSYLSAQQLQVFGAGQFIVTLLGVSIVRELGPVLAAILVAGRSGSAITAQIGVMRVTEELDAMRVMGLSLGQRLILPRVAALALAMPLLVLWTDAMALAGGMLAAYAQLGLTPSWFLQQLPDAITINNYWITLGKGLAFGVLVALVACHFGLRIEPNTESLGRGTTASVVTSITGVILVDALFAIIFSQVGI